MENKHSHFLLLAAAKIMSFSFISDDMFIYILLLLQYVTKNHIVPLSPKMLYQIGIALMC